MKVNCCNVRSGEDIFVLFVINLVCWTNFGAILMKMKILVCLKLEAGEFRGRLILYRICYSFDVVYDYVH